MYFECQQQGRMHLVRIAPRLDIDAAPEFEARLMEAITEGARCLVIDLSRLEYLSSGGLRTIIAVSKTLKALEGSIALCGAHGIVKDVFEMSGLAAAFPFYSSIEEAQKQIGEGNLA